MKKFCLGIIAVALASCNVAIKYDYDAGTDFKAYKTYDYFGDMQSGLSVLDERRLIRALDTKLSSMGISKSRSPDFYIDIRGISYVPQNTSSISVGVGGTSGSTAGAVGVSLPLDQGPAYDEMVIEFVDERKSEVFWLADLNVIISTASTPEKRDEYFMDLADKILKKYPPSG